MTGRPSDRAIATAFWETTRRVLNSHEEVEGLIINRARELDAGAGGDDGGEPASAPQDLRLACEFCGCRDTWRIEFSGGIASLICDEREGGCGIAPKRVTIYTTPPAAVVPEWQPIETAPTDGRDLMLLLTPSGWPQVVYSNAWWTAGFSVECKPFGWYPIPQPKAQSAAPAQEVG